MLGYRGHFSTKRRRYSTTLGTLRQARADHAREIRDVYDEERQTSMIKEWRYTGSGLRHREHLWADIARQNIATARGIARQQAG
jgi:hypothetical protein